MQTLAHVTPITGTDDDNTLAPALTPAERRARAATEALAAKKPSRFKLADEEAFWAPVEDADGRIVGEAAVCVTENGILHAVWRPKNGREQAVPLVAVATLSSVGQV